MPPFPIGICFPEPDNDTTGAEIYLLSLLAPNDSEDVIRLVLTDDTGSGRGAGGRSFNTAGLASGLLSIACSAAVSYGFIGYL